MLQAGIVGLPNVGKSTLFNALTSSVKAEAANYPFCTIEPNKGIVIVPDERLEILKKLVNPEKIVPTVVEFCDIAGLVKGASKGEGLGNRFLANIREVDSIIHIVRCFEDDNVVHVNGKPDPISDIETINLELALADLASVEKRKERILKTVKSRDKTAILENKVIDKLMELLNDGKPFSTDIFEKDELQIVKSLNLLTVKPVIYVANVAESNLSGKDNPMVEEVRKYAEAHNSEIVIISAALEAELIALGAEQAKEYLKESGIEDSGMEKMIKKVYSLLKLRTFITAGEKEVKAWTITEGTKAPQAAGVIHTDFEKGFIRAEITAYNAFVDCGSYVVAREKGLTRLEGKEYVIQDGDIVHFRFNV